MSGSADLGLAPRIHFRIQHSPGREAALSRLLSRIPLAVVVADEEAATDCNPLRNYLRCLADPPPAATHLCVLQDDVLPCQNFAERLEEAVANRPADLISLFVGGLKGQATREFLRAMTRRDPWCPLPRSTRIVHVVALCWPVAVADDFLRWYGENESRIPAPRPHRSDDMVVSYWLKTAKPWRTVWATVPCLVEHPDDIPSVAQLRRGGTGSDKGRRAIWFAG